MEMKLLNRFKSFSPKYAPSNTKKYFQITEKSMPHIYGDVDEKILG